MIRCSEAGLLAGEPLTASAPVAMSWVVLEQPGPWGPKALTDSHLDPDLGAALEARATRHDARVSLVRRPGHHADTVAATSHRLWIAATRPGASWLLGGWIASPAVLDQLSWPALAAGDHRGVAASVPGLELDPDPLLLVCTNGRRDVCCALTGRPLVEALRDRLLGRVWETTHLSGHRFAPTAVVLPHGVAYGRLDPATAAKVFDAARDGHFVAENYRGRSTFTRPAQAAEAAVRQVTAAGGLDDLDVVSVERRNESWRAVVVHQGGRRWAVDVHEKILDGSRPESCGATSVPPTVFVADPPRLGLAHDPSRER
jgi:(2Fe-2S) ferredoxin